MIATQDGILGTYVLDTEGVYHISCKPSYRQMGGDPPSYLFWMFNHWIFGQTRNVANGGILKPSTVDCPLGEWYMHVPVPFAIKIPNC